MCVCVCFIRLESSFNKKTHETQTHTRMSHIPYERVVIQQTNCHITCECVIELIHSTHHLSSLSFFVSLSIYIHTHVHTYEDTRARVSCLYVSTSDFVSSGLIKWYSTPSPNLSPYIFLGLDPSPSPLHI